MGQDLNIPQELRTHVTEALGDDGRRWLDELPRTIAAVERNWSLTVAEPFGAGEFNFVAPAVTNKGEDVVIKIAPPYTDGEFYSEVAYLRTNNGSGCVQLLAENRDLRSMMIERAVPGRNLTEEFAGRQPDGFIPAINVLKKLRGMAAGKKDVIMLDRWFDGLRQAVATGFPAAYVNKALQFYSEMKTISVNEYLHGDFHPGNIVSASREQYLAIDPKGIIGPLGYDIAVFLNNYHWWQETHADVRERLAGAVDLFADTFGMDQILIRQWAFCQMVLGAWWTFDEMPLLYNNEVAKAEIWEI
jgi:streptomycin 6-kinase